MNSTSSIIGALGGGSGVDMAKLAADLSSARFAAQVKQLEARSQLMETRISAAATIKGQVAQLASAIGERVRTGDLAPSARVADGAVASASVAPGARAEGSYSLEVTRLATTQVLASRSYASPRSQSGCRNAADHFWQRDRHQLHGRNKAAARRRGKRAGHAIHPRQQDQRERRGLTAYVAQSAAGAQLVVKGEEGAASGFTLSGSGASASGTDFLGRPVAPREGQINFLDWHPSDDGGRLKQAAGDAAFLFDGVAMARPSNRVDKLPAGLTLQLAQANPWSAHDYQLRRQGGRHSGCDERPGGGAERHGGHPGESAKPLGGELGNDSGARALKRTLAGLAGTVVMPNAPAGAPRTLGDLGLSTGQDGTFRLDGERLARTLQADPQGAAAMFTPGLYGVYATFDKLARAVGLSSDPGTLGRLGRPLPAAAGADRRAAGAARR